MQRFRAPSCLALLLLLALCVACSGPEARTRPTPLPVATRPPLEGARPVPMSGGVVTVYSALSEAANDAIVAAFRRAQPTIAVDILGLAAAGELQARIRREAAAPRADVLLGGSSEYHEPLAREGLLEAYRSPGAGAIEPHLKDPNGYWTGWYLGIFGIVLNTERWSLERSGRVKPATWDDLLEPDLAGALAMPDPLTTGGGYIFLANQVFRFNRSEARAMEYMRRLHANLGRYTETAPLTIELVAQGRFLMGLNWGHDVLAAASEGRQVAFLAPEETAFEVGAVSILRGGPNAAAARSFVDWVLSRESAELIVKTSNRLSVLPRVEPAPGAPTLESVSLASYDREWATLNRERLLQKWQATVGR